MQNTEVILLIRRYRILLLVIMVLSAAIAGYLVKTNKQTGYAEAKFMMANNLYAYGTNNDNTFATAGVTTDKSQILAQVTFIYSDEMLNFLEEKLHLYDYYGIDKKSPAAFMRLRDKLVNRMRLNYLDNGIITLSYTDKSSEMATNIVNSVISHLEKINKAFVLERLYREVAIYNKLIAERSRQEQAAKDTLKSLIDGLKDSEVARKGSMTSEAMMDIRMDVYRSVYDIGAASRELGNVKKMYTFAVDVVSDESNEIIKVINIAYPEEHLSISTLLIAIFLTPVILLMITLFFLYNLHAYKDELKVIFGK